MATKKNPYEIQFKTIKIDWLVNTFGLKKVQQLDALDQWLSDPPPPLASYTEILEKLRQKLTNSVDQWSEYELYGYFISPLIALADMETEDFRPFGARELRAQIDDYCLFGYPDLTLAKGIGEPGPPYFCFHEYKREVKGSGDPQGQLLGEMLAGQANNLNFSTIWGAFVVGENWRFVVLQERIFAVSGIFNAADSEDLHAIYGILVNLKREIKAVINAQNA